MAGFLLLVELCLRFAGVHYESSLYRLDRDLGYVLRPNAAGWSVKERDHFEQVSSQGLRDRYHPLTPPPDVIRIAVVGDSFSEAKQVDPDQAYWAVMERDLNRLLQSNSGDRSVEVVNFGVAGYGLPQEYLTIKQRIWQFNPQIVLLTGNLHSLILDSDRRFASIQVSGGPTPYFVRTADGLVLDETTRKQQAAFLAPSALTDLIADLTNNSEVLSLLNATRRTLSLESARLRQSLHSVDQHGAAAAQSELSFEETVLRGPEDPQFAPSWGVAEELIRLAAGEVQRHHAEFWFVLLDMAPQVDPDPDQRQALMSALGIHDLYLGDRHFSEFATRQGIRHILTAAELRAIAERDHTLLHGFPRRPRNSGHWNETGHEAAGELLARHLFTCSDTLAAVRSAAAATAAAVATSATTCGDELPARPADIVSRDLP